MGREMNGMTGNSNGRETITKTFFHVGQSLNKFAFNRNGH